jgi:hypothetical protein
MSHSYTPKRLELLATALEANFESLTRPNRDVISAGCLEVYIRDAAFLCRALAEGHVIVEPYRPVSNSKERLWMILGNTAKPKAS